MKLAEFRSLCQKEWDEHRGEPVTLWLTENSYRELSEESLMAGAQDQMWLNIREGYETPSHASFGSFERKAVLGARVSAVINPITRNAVQMKLALDKDAAEVFSGRDKVVLTRVLETGNG